MIQYYYPTDLCMADYCFTEGKLYYIEEKEDNNLYINDDYQDLVTFTQENLSNYFTSTIDIPLIMNLIATDYSEYLTKGDSYEVIKQGKSTYYVYYDNDGDKQELDEEDLKEYFIINTSLELWI